MVLFYLEFAKYLLMIRSLSIAVLAGIALQGCVFAPGQEMDTGSIIGDLTSRRGMVRGQDTRGNANVIDAMVPLANMFGYINNLRSMSSGRAVFTMQFDHYEAVPQNISDEIQKKYA